MDWLGDEQTGRWKARVMDELVGGTTGQWASWAIDDLWTHRGTDELLGDERIWRWAIGGLFAQEDGRPGWLLLSCFIFFAHGRKFDIAVHLALRRL